MHLSIFFLLLFFLTNLQPSFSQLTSFNISNSPWLPSQNRTLTSSNKNFSAGFFPIPNSPNQFTFSIWFTKIPQTSNPLIWSIPTKLNSSSSLVITSKGELLLNNVSFVNHSNSSQLVLDDSGKLVFGNWTSFLNPTNTILPKQNISDIEIVSSNKKFKFINSSFLILNDNDNDNSSQYYNTPSPLVSMDDLGKMTMQANSFLTSDYGDSRIRKLVLDDDGYLRIYSFFFLSKRIHGLLFG